MKPPPSCAVTSCSGIGRLAPPRARSWAMRRSPTSLQQQEALVVGAGVDRRLHVLVVEPLDAAHHRPVDLGGRQQARRRRGAGPRRRRGARHPGSRLAAASRQHLGVQRHPHVGAVDGLAALAGDSGRARRRAARTRARRRWRSGRGSPSPSRSRCIAWSRSIEPGGSMVKNGQRGLVALGQARRRGRDLLGLGERVGRVVERQAELGAHRGEPVAPAPAAPRRGMSASVGARRTRG